MRMCDIIINGIELRVKAGITIMEACKTIGIIISRYCYNEDLLISGNCRMCLVEVEGIEKPIASCSEPVRENMVIYTESSLVKKAREGVMEFLLLNHPLDCPVCDQGGECDLQEGSMDVGAKQMRSYQVIRKEVGEKLFGNLVKTWMKRCIACSRCVRFMASVCGQSNLGIVGRGVNVEISMYREDYGIETMHMVGNIVDLCPVKGKNDISSN